jgi:hypothetical protein
VLSVTKPNAVPREEILFEPVHDRYGLRLALVFGNHAPGGRCPYYAEERCFHCDIGAGEGTAFDHAANRERLAWFQAHYQNQLKRVRHLVVYNSGSVLNPREMPASLLDEIVAFGRSIPSVRAISLDSREAFIRQDVLRRILQRAGNQLLIRPILGIESADDRIRDEVLKKQMPRLAVFRAFRNLGLVAAEFGHKRVGLDVNILVAGPGTRADTAIADALLTARFALDAGREHGVSIDLNIHPYYVGARGMTAFLEHPRCSLTTMVHAVREIALLVQATAPLTSLFLGWHDEGHDSQAWLREIDLSRARGAFDEFNRTNDPGALDCLK